YPPPRRWIVENQSIWDLWSYQINCAPQPDVRISRKSMFMVDTAKLDYDVGPDESAIFEDENGKLVAMVISDFCKCKKVLHWVNEIVLLNVALEKNEDAGSIVICGWSAGLRSRTHLDLARNLESKHKLSPSQKGELQYKSASVFALFWNLVKSLGPSVVVADLEDLVKGNNLYRMDTAIANGGKQQTYTIDVDGGVPVTFHNAELAPPSGVFARNYARAVHFERQPHDWSASWTTFRDNSKGDMGGHFYLASYGIRIQGASNKVVFWKPGDWHGTSLPNLSPAEKGGPLLQSGMAIVMSPRLPKAFDDFHKGKITRAQLIV
ncbi:hypothetical protein BDP27DRAFT_1185820, partial [Rhodocollybia butyracea]